MRNRTRLMVLFPLLLISFLPAHQGDAASVRSKHSLTPKQLVRNIQKKSFSGEVMSFDFHDSDVHQVFKRFEDISGIEFVLKIDIPNVPQLKFMGVEWDRALSLVLRNLELELEPDGSRLLVTAKGSNQGGPFVGFVSGSGAAVFLILLSVFILKSRQKKSRIKKLHKKVALSDERRDEITKKLLYLFDVEKIYREESLSLNVLADRLNIPPHHLSWILNARIGKSYSDFLNHYRVEEVKKNLRDRAQRDRSILDIAYSAGFSSKSAFNNKFKAIAGKTPSDYKQQTIN